MLTRIAALTLAVMVGLIASQAARAAPTIADFPVASLDTRHGKIAGYGNVLAWSEYDVTDATFSLVAQQEGQAPRRLDTKSRNRPFDVDAGPGRDGKPTLVYSRCRNEPKQPDRRGLYEYFGLPRYPGGSGCDIYTYSLTAGRERRLDAISSRDADEFMPSIWRSTVAFARRYRSNTRLYLNRGEGSDSRQLAGWRANRVPEVISTDLRGRRLSYQTVHQIDFCERSSVRIVDSTSFKTYIRIAEPGRRSITVAASCNNDARQANLSGGAWSGSRLIYSADSGRDYERGRVVARPLRGRQQTLATYAFPNSYTKYLAANDHGIFGVVFKGSDGSAHISQLLDRP